MQARPAGSSGATQVRITTLGGDDLKNHLEGLGRKKGHRFALNRYRIRIANKVMGARGPRRLAYRLGQGMTLKNGPTGRRKIIRKEFCPKIWGFALEMLQLGVRDGQGALEDSGSGTHVVNGTKEGRKNE